LLSSPMDRLIGVFLVALSAACFGTNAVFARIGYDAGANVSTFLFIRFAITSYKILGACLVIGAVIILAKSEYRTAQAQIR